MRAVVDTNVLVSGILWRGAPHAVLARIRAGVLQLVTSPELLAELAGVITRPKFGATFARSNTKAERVLTEIRRLAEIVEPPALVAPVSRDRDDDAVLALAVAARPAMIVSGDADLLVLRVHAGVPILSPADAIAEVDQGKA